MDDTTVTMSLKRYKELESYEAAFNALKQDTGRFIWVSAWGSEYFVELSNEPNAILAGELKAAIKYRDDVIKEVRDYQERTGKKVFKYG